MTGADALIKCLVRAGVTDIFGLPGSSTTAILDAVAREPGLRFYSTRHEHVAGCMADAYARATGRPGVVVAHTGLGVANMTLAVGFAYRDGTPMVVISGNVESQKLGREAWQELDVLRLLQPITKWSGRIDRVEEIPRLAEEALRASVRGRPGPVHLDFPKDLQRAPFPAELPAELRPLKAPLLRPAPEAAAVEEVWGRLQQARRPLLMAGKGVLWAEAWEGLARVSEAIALPVVTTESGRGALSEDHPLCVGIVGGSGDAGANAAIREADAILAVGCRFSDLSTNGWTLIPDKTILLHVDIDPEGLQKYYPDEIPIQADAGAFLDALGERLGGSPPVPPWAGWAERFRQERLREREAFLSRPTMSHQIIRALADAAQARPLIFTSCGSRCGRFYRRVPVRHPRSWLKGVNLGAMSGAFPMALGAMVARPKATVVALCGDGDFAMVMQDLETAVRYGLPVVTVIFNDAAYGSIRAIQQKEHGGRLLGTEYRNPDFAELARLFGAEGRRAETPDAFRRALTEALAIRRPVVIDAIIPPEEADV